MRSLNKKNFIRAVILSLLLSLTLLFLSLQMGKANLFLLLNGNGGIFFDALFMWFTLGGDGIMWIPVLIITLFLIKRKDAIILLVGTFIFSTIFTQVIKNFIFSNEARPIKAITESNLIHTITGVEVHTIGSFPSGHTATGFCIYFLFCLLLGNNWWLIVGFIYATLVGYSRVYLAQHFPLDVGAGIIIAILSVWLALRLQEYWWKKKKA